MKASLNGRVIAVDLNNGRQLHHFGEIRGQGPARQFLLATRENRFFTPLDDNLPALLRDLDAAATPDEAAEESLVQIISARLGYSLDAPQPADDLISSDGLFRRLFRSCLPSEPRFADAAFAESDVRQAKGLGMIFPGVDDQARRVTLDTTHVSLGDLGGG